MNERLYKSLKWTAIILTVAWIGWSFYDGFYAQRKPGDNAYFAGNNLFKDGYYERALREYEQALNENPNHIHARRGKARSLLQLKRYQAALTAFNQALTQAPDFATTYANRGILYDRMGRHEEALADYERALQMDNRLADGPDWLTRFFRLQPEPPPTIADRAQYLREQLAKPPSERLLRQPELDDKQRPFYK
jgi:tetratricopeptide (TPR) repeat protein